MRTLLVAALLVSLVANVYSQQIPDPPSAEQLQCITSASTEQTQDIARDCGNADFANVRMYV